MVQTAPAYCHDGLTLHVQMQFVIHDVLQAHYHKDPKHRFPPIPTLAVSIPIDHSSQHHLCYTARYSTAPAQVSPEDIRATASSLLRAVKQLEPDQDAQSMQHALQEKDGRPLRKYYIKRNYSGESKICAYQAAVSTVKIQACWLGIYSVLLGVRKLKACKVVTYYAVT